MKIDAKSAAFGLFAGILVSLTVAAQNGTGPMHKEYKVFVGKSSGDLQTELNKNAADGWELSTMANGQVVYVVMTRTK